MPCIACRLWLTRVEAALVGNYRTEICHAAGAQTELVVLATLAEQGKYNVVTGSDDDGAQSGLRALNAVNVVRAIVGNGVNATATRSASSLTGSMARLQSQTNSFVQIGGLGR